ncbi:MAG TPA: nuclear transport factor 2 family protein [Methylomirabilota bacterium]|jgi:ketosteroid isomerase-like protein|nr:nuclear transport factor 2 family protein [Methylomirabilota bacterium]
MNEQQEVEAANRTFYQAFETLDITEMEKVWLRAPYIKCVHPGWPLLVGWGPIMTSWERIFDNTLSMQFTLTDVRVEASATLGWVVLIEDLAAQGYDGPSRSQILATNVFEKKDGRWFIVHHHASPILAPPMLGEDRLQ